MLERVPARRDAGFVPLPHYLSEPDAGVHHGVEAPPIEEPRVPVRTIGIEHQPTERFPAPVEERHEIDRRVVQPDVGKSMMPVTPSVAGSKSRCPA